MDITLGFLPSLMLWRAWRIKEQCQNGSSRFPSSVFYVKYLPDFEFDIVPTPLNEIPTVNICADSHGTWKRFGEDLKELLQDVLCVFELEDDAMQRVKSHKMYTLEAMNYFNQYSRFWNTTKYLQPVRLTYDFALDLPVLMPSRQRGSHAHVRSGVAPSYVKQPIKKGCLYELVCSQAVLSRHNLSRSTHIYVLSPKYLLVYAARIMGAISVQHTHHKIIQMHNMLRLMCEFTGTYTYDPLCADVAIYNAESLCNVDNLKNFCREYYNAPDKTLYMQACAHALDGLASPLETAVALALSLPKKYGGIHLGEPLINKTRYMQKERELTLHHYLTPDIYFKEYHVAIECNGEAFHNSKEGYTEDQRRARDYASLGDVYIPVVYNDVQTPERLQMLLTTIAKVCRRQTKTRKAEYALECARLSNRNNQQDVLVRMLL